MRFVISLDGPGGPLSVLALQNVSFIQAHANYLLSNWARTLFRPLVLIRYGCPLLDLISFLVLSFLNTASVQSLSSNPSRV
jgi:hypothetical protein